MARPQDHGQTQEYLQNYAGTYPDPQPYGPWNSQPRQRCREFEPLPVNTAIPGLKTVAAEMQEQVRHCNQEIQKDLDCLHKQVLAEVHSAVTQELVAVAQGLAQLRAELLAEVEALRGTSAELRQQAQQDQRMRSVREQDVKDTAEKLAKVCADLRKDLQSEIAALRQLSASLDERLQQEMAEGFAEVWSRVQEEPGLRQTQDEQLAKRLEERTAAIEHHMEILVQELRRETEAEASERSQLQVSVQENLGGVEKSLAQLEEALRGGALVSEARFRESQAAMAALEQRQQAAIRETFAGVVGKSEEVGLRAKYELETFREGLAAEFRERLHTTEKKMKQLGEDCREEFAFAHSSWARTIEWTAEVDIEKLEHDGKCDVGSPFFTAAGLRPLRLQLRLSRQQEPGKPLRWACGAFLRAPHGKVSFRLTIAGRMQAFAADFAEASEWGSQKLVLLERVPQRVAVSLEILDVVALIPGTVGGGQPALVASVQMTDAAQAAAKEAALIRSTMVRRVEWRVSRITERLAAAREAGSSMGDDEALEPLLSPPFAAAGFEGLQLQLYPLGYRPRGDEACGFFLTCPKGMYVKCKAFVGDNVRNFEHQYDTREPYGRGSFCRLIDKVDADDCVVCGVEFLEVRQEQTTQVRGGPFGNTADQLKLVNNPSVGGMEVIRELKELPGPSGEKKPAKGYRKASTGRENALVGSGYNQGIAAAMRATAPLLASTSMSESKSLPSLLPTVSSFGMGAGSTGPVSPPKGVDAMNWR